MVVGAQFGLFSLLGIQGFLGALANRKANVFAALAPLYVIRAFRVPFLDSFDQNHVRPNLAVAR